MSDKESMPEEAKEILRLRGELLAVYTVLAATIHQAKALSGDPTPVSEMFSGVPAFIVKSRLELAAQEGYENGISIIRSLLERMAEGLNERRSVV